MFDWISGWGVHLVELLFILLEARIWTFSCVEVGFLSQRLIAITSAVGISTQNNLWELMQRCRENKKWQRWQAAVKSERWPWCWIVPSVWRVPALIYWLRSTRTFFLFLTYYTFHATPPTRPDARTSKEVESFISVWQCLYEGRGFFLFLELILRAGTMRPEGT